VVTLGGAATAYDKAGPSPEGGLRSSRAAEQLLKAITLIACKASEYKSA